MATAAFAVGDRSAAARHARARARNPAREKNHRRRRPPEDSSSPKCSPARAVLRLRPPRTAWTTADRESRRRSPASARRRSETARQSLPTAAAASCTPARSASRTRKSGSARSFPASAVKTPVKNIIRHAFGKLRRSHAAAQRLPDLRRRDRQRHGFQAMHARAIRTSVIVPRPRYDNKCNRLNHVLPAIPTANFGEGVGADDEKNLAVHRFHPLDGIDRVTFFLAFFKTRRHEALVGGAGQFHHAIAILIARAGFF